MEKPKFLVVGTGFIFKKHLEAIQEIGGEVIYATNQENGWQDKVKEADYVVILTPSYLHKEQISQVLEIDANKKIICEKPLSLKSEDVENMPDSVNTILQLRNKPIGYEKANYYTIELKVIAPRNAEYWDTWKGKREGSGGILMNLGLHYFDLIQQLFGEPERVQTWWIDDKKAMGRFFGKNYSCSWEINCEAFNSYKQAERILTINWERHDLTEDRNYHINEYQNIVAGKGIKPKEAVKSIKLIERIYDDFNSRAR